MQERATNFIARLHRDGFKTLGFRKQRHVFSREHVSYTERVQVQGSSWNEDDESSWSFYMNAGLYFPDLPEPTRNRGFANTHVYGRLRRFDPRCEDSFELSDANEALVHDVVMRNVTMTLRAFEENIKELRSFARTGRFLWPGNAT